MSTSANNNSNNGVALDLSRKRKKKRILIVRKSNSNDAGEQTNPTFPQTNDSTASLRSTGAGIQYGSPTRSVKRKGIVLARNVNAESLRSLGPTSPVQIRKEEGPRVDPKTKRILERSILGTVEEYEDMVGNGQRGSRRRSFQSRNAEGQKGEDGSSNNSKKNERKKSMMGGGNLQSITDSSFADNQAEDELFMYRQRLTNPEEVAKRRKRIEDARKEEQEYMDEEEQEMLMCDLIVSRRETNALKKWKKIQKTWRTFRTNMAKSLGKHPDDLVVSRAMEYREKREEYDMLEGATPADLKHGSEYWMMSLRGMGTRYVPVGNIFSGLFCPVNEEKEYEIDIVRQPGMKDPNRKNPPKDWRHSHTLMDRQKRLKKQLNEMRPHFIGVAETESLVVRAENLFEWAENSSNEYFKRVENEGENITILEKELIKDGKEGKVGTTDDEKEIEAIEDMLPKSGPNMLLYGKTEGNNNDTNNNDGTRLLLTSNVKAQSDGTIVAENIGTTAIFYEWVKLESTPALDPSLTGGAHSQGQLYCRDRAGVLLPGHTKDFSFSFRSNVAGIFTEKWAINTTPSLFNGISQEVTVRCVVVEEDVYVKQREAIENKLAEQALVHGVEDILRDVVRDIRTPPPPPPTEEELKIKDFENKNTDLPTKIYYDETLYEETKMFAQKVFLATVPPREEVVVVEETTEEGGKTSDVEGDTMELTGEEKNQDEFTEEESSKMSVDDIEIAQEDSKMEESAVVEEEVIENPEEIAMAREWTGSFTDLLNVIKEEIIPLNLELAESLIDELQSFQQKFAAPPVSSSLSMAAGREFFTQAALLVPETSDELLSEHGLEPRPKFKRPRSLKPGQEEDPNRKLVKRSGAWEERKTVGEDGEELELTDSEKYRIAFEKAMTTKVMALVDAFVDGTIKSDKDNLRESRQLQNMEFSKIECPWEAPKDDEEEDDEEGGGEEEEGEDGEGAEAKEIPPLPPVLAAVNGGSVLLRSDMNFILEDEGDQGFVVVDNKANDKRMQNIALDVKRLIAENALVITIVGHLGNPKGERLPEFSLANTVEGLSDLCETPIEFLSTFEEVLSIVNEEKEKKRVKDEKVAMKEAKRLEKIRLREERRAEQGSDYDEDEDDDEDEEEDEEEEEEDDESPPCRVLLVENIGYVPAEHSDYMANIPENAEEEDIEERQAEIDGHFDILSQIADIHIIDDLSGCLTQNASIVSVSPQSSLVVPGLVLQREIQVYSKFLEAELNEGEKRLAIVGGNDLEGKVDMLKALLRRVDEIMLVGNIATLFERARREWDIRNTDPDAVTDGANEGEKDEDESPRAEDDEEEEEDDEGDEEEEDDGEGEEKEGPVTMLKENEIRLMPIARMLFAEIKRRGLGLHLPSDYVVGDESPNYEEEGFEVDYDGETLEWVIPAVGSQNEDGTPISGRAAFGLPPRDMFVLDIGPDTQEKFGEIIKNSTNVIWIDTVGAIQHGEGQAGTGVILEAISGILENGGVGIAVGSNLVNALRTTNGVEDETLSLVSNASCNILLDIMCNGIPGIQNLKRVEEPSQVVEETEETNDETTENE